MLFEAEPEGGDRGMAEARVAGLARQLASLREQQRAVADVLRAVARSEGLGVVFAVALEAANRLCDGDFGSLYMVEGELLRPVAQQGGSPEQAEYELSHPHTKDRHTLVGRVAVTEQPVHIPDALADPEYSWPGQQMSGYRAMLGLPILVDRQLIGVIGVVRNEPKPFTDEQIELMQTFADQAAIAIANARLIDAVERQRGELSRFLSPQVADLVSSPEGEQLLAGHRAYISCLFSDLRGFTGFVETAEPEELLEVLRSYHAVLGELIRIYEGTLEHFAGDGVMVFFNDPLPVEEHELQAIRLALAAQERFAKLAQNWRKRGIELSLGIGIAAGYATLGRIGFEGRYDYGALGPVTNLASRLSSFAQPGQVLISQRVLAAVEQEVDAQAVGEIELKGFTRPVPAHEVRSLKTTLEGRS
jgi:class 3 adenylate cyclase